MTDFYQEERKNEILDVAERLFGEKGFDNTSTNDILQEIGIARGTLYYHFKSKEDILDAMIERMTEQLLAKASAIAAKEEIPVLQRLTLTIMSLNVNNEVGREVMKQVHRPQNALMHQKMQEKLLKGVNPLMTGLIMEGIEQGLCHTDYPKEAIGILFIWICMMRGEAELYQICIGVLVSSFFSSLLAVSDIKLLLVIDIATFFLTVTLTAVVKKAVYETQKEKRESFGESLRIGFRAITDRKGVFMLILVSSVMTCFMGVIGFLSQIGYVVAYGISGIAADGIAEKCGISVGRGAAVIVRISGLLLAVTAGCLYLTRSIRELERKK